MRVQGFHHVGTAPVERDLGGAPTIRRVALLSVHTCPLDQPGVGDSGGMNVYVRQVARRLAEMGVGVDVFTRWSGAAEPIRQMDPGVRVIHLEAGPGEPIPKEALQDHLCEFLYSLIRFEAQESAALGASSPVYDLIHSHYWLSGWVGRLAAERLGIPLVQSFHTLGRVKNLNLAAGERAESSTRITAEERVVASADAVMAPTASEAAELVRLYGADPEDVHIVPPGVDTERFTPAGPGERARAKAAIGFDGRAVVLFVGRLQPLKAPDLAVRAVAELSMRAPGLDPVLVVVGGPSGEAGMQPATLCALAAELGIEDRVVIHEPVPHTAMPDIYRAADVLLVPSRTESFGLVALEGSACGTPVVAADVGGLRTAVRDGVSGILVAGHEPGPYADALAHVLAAGVRYAMGEAGSRYARRFDWRQAAGGLLDVYEELVAAAVAG